MKELETITLCEERKEHLWVTVSAVIENGCLKISGQDLGDAVADRFGDDEYEYGYNFDEKNTEALTELLTANGRSLKEALLEEFGGMEGCRRLCGFCGANKIEYEHWSWR